MILDLLIIVCLYYGHGLSWFVKLSSVDRFMITKRAVALRHLMTSPNIFIHIHKPSICTAHVNRHLNFFHMNARVRIIIVNNSSYDTYVTKLLWFLCKVQSYFPNLVKILVNYGLPFIKSWNKHKRLLNVKDFDKNLTQYNAISFLMLQSSVEIAHVSIYLTDRFNHAFTTFCCVFTTLNS